MTDTTKSPQDRPLVTFALFAYNQEKYIREAVEGAFSQTYEPLEIILSDDCSSDRTFAIMQEMAETFSGKHKVKLRRNSNNMGLTSHVNQILEISEGEVFVFAAGDDISETHRVSQLMAVFSGRQDVVSVLSGRTVIESDGRARRIKQGRHDKGVGAVEYTLDDLWTGCAKTSGATRAIKRSVYNIFGPLDPSCPTEDTPFFLRSLIVGRVIRISDKLVRYRVHANNLSHPASIGSMEIDLIINQYVKDLELAALENLIEEEEIRKTRRWIQRIRLLREMEKIEQSGGLLTLPRAAVGYLTSPLPAKEKVERLVGYLVRRYRRSLQK